MRKHLHWLLSASLGLGGVAFMGCERNSGGNPQANKDSSQSADSKILNNKSDAASVAGSRIPGDQIGTVDLTRIYGTLKDVSEDAFTKNHFDNLVGRFTAADKDRIGKGFANQKFDDLDGRIDQLNKDYKAKYGHSFDIEKTKVFENWVSVQKTGEDKDNTYANVMFPASHGLPALTVPVAKHMEVWRLDVPDDVSGSQLKQSLLDHLTAIDNMKDQWPAQELEGQRMMVHHVFMALFNKPVNAQQ
jgi:hypothetical protein